eukprot:3139145-Rhodomonas_salina.1
MSLSLCVCTAHAVLNKDTHTQEGPAADSRFRHSPRRTWLYRYDRCPLSPYALPTRCPVLTYALPCTNLRAPYALSGTDLRAAWYWTPRHLPSRLYTKRSQEGA